MSSEALQHLDSDVKHSKLVSSQVGIYDLDLNRPSPHSFQYHGDRSLSISELNSSQSFQLWIPRNRSIIREDITPQSFYELKNEIVYFHNPGQSFIWAFHLSNAKELHTAINEIVTSNTLQTFSNAPTNYIIPPSVYPQDYMQPSILPLPALPLLPNTSLLPAEFSLIANDVSAQLHPTLMRIVKDKPNLHFFLSNWTTFFHDVRSTFSFVPPHDPHFIDQVLTYLNDPSLLLSTTSNDEQFINLLINAIASLHPTLARQSPHCQFFAENFNQICFFILSSQSDPTQRQTLASMAIISSPLTTPQSSVNLDALFANFSDSEGADL